MIQLRKNPFSEVQIDVPFVEGETASQLVDRALQANGYELSENVLTHFHVVVNGHVIEKDMWPLCQIREEDNVLIAPRIARGSGGQLFKQIAIISIAIAASVFFGPEAGMGTWEALGAAATVAGITVAGTLLMNALIPPPALPGLGLGGLGNSTDESQMYTITSQQNAAKKFGYVPKVYGTHRIYPVVAANPYTEIEADPATGTLVQYYYAIYDFGFGPADIREIKIGDTSISDYAEAQYRLVDLNKPAVSEGHWDDVLFDNFVFYKGDVERDGSAFALDKNQSDTGAVLADYQVIRNASSAVNGSAQEITLDFVNSQGLKSYGTNGDTTLRYIDLKIEFSKVDEDVWKPFNDSTFVDDFRSAGGDTPYTDNYVTLPPLNTNTGSVGYTLLSRTRVTYHTLFDGWLTTFYNTFGYPVGTTRILLATSSVPTFTEMDGLYLAGNRIGKIVSTSPGPMAGYTWYNLESPTTTAFAIFQVDTGVNRVVGTNKLVSNFYSSMVYLKKYSYGILRISANTQNPYYSSVSFKPKAVSQYKIRITRVNSFSVYTYSVLDKLTLASISTRFDRKPIVTDKRHVFLELRIKATNQLNGSITNLSAVASSVLDVYDTTTDTWSKQVTSNPAWIYCDLLTGEVNKRAISRSRLHLPSIVEWAEFCDEVPPSTPTKDFNSVRFSSNFILDFNTTLQALINNVTNSAQASLNIIDGKYGILIDKLRTVPVQIFTPRNSTNFSSTRNYDDAPDGLTIQYVDPLSDWDISEVTVYDEGFTADTAVNFDSLSTFGCTNPEQAWRFGRYMIAQARLRKETISIEVDFEHLVCTRGDYVQITQDVMKVGGTPARVKEITGVDTVKIDDAIDTSSGLSYAYVYRGVSGIKTSTCDVIDSDEFRLYGEMPSVGDLIIIGESGKVVFECIVKAIAPSSELKATVVLVERAAGIYNVESSDDYPDYDPQLNTNIDAFSAPAAVEDLIVTDNSWRVIGGAYQYYIDLDWDLPIGSAVDAYEVYANYGTGYDLVSVTKATSYEYIVNENNLGILHSFKVLAVSATGKKLSLAEVPEVSATPMRKVGPPSDVSALFMNITKEVLQLEWPSVLDADLKEYIIRYSPNTTTATWESSIPLVRVDKNSTSTAVQGRTGTYFIKALDLNGTQSYDAAQAKTTIPNLFDLNVISETNDFPLLEGELDTVETDASGLVLKRVVSGGVTTNQYYSEGYYYYKDFLDLGDIYSVRLQSQIEAEGFTVGDMMSEWPDLTTLTALANAGNSDWDVETYYRATDSYNVMAEWSSLDDVDPISEGDQDNWTAWRKFTIGDATARIFQFRLKLISNKASVTPRVFNGVIKSDMPDRFETLNNLIAPPAGLEILYTPAFMGPGTTPNIQITQDSAQTGDTFVIENKTLNGFKITFYDINNVAVTRQFDAAIKGFGRKSLAVI
jgi:hypothetical protein